MQSALPASLSVFGPNGLVGTVYPGEPLAFSYAQSWLDSPGATALHPALVLVPGRTDSRFVTAFFENLLPEGDQRKLISMREQVTSVYGLLCKVGGESAGSVVLLPEGEQPQPPVYQALTWEQVSALAHAGSRPKEQAAIERAARDLPAPRMSLSGAQHKLLLYIDDAGNPCRPMGSSPSTHILKPDIARQDIHVFASAANETIIMLLAQQCGLPVARVAYQPMTRACLVERYDRQRSGDGALRRIWQADFCQLLGVASDVKYEHDGGPGIKDCFDLLGQSTQPGVDRRHLLRWLFFNLCTGNNDSHAKNLSMIASARGMRLAPFYDLMCTRVYSGLGSRFAFSIGGETNPGKIGAQHVAELASTLGVGEKYLKKLGREMASAVEAALPVAAQEVLPLLDPGERILVERIMNKVGSLTRKVKHRISGGNEAGPDEEGDTAGM